MKPWLAGCALAWAQACQAQTGSAKSVENQVIDAVCDKQVVALGELPSHGEAGGFRFKASIVQGLVERCGFAAVLFEAPIYGFIGFNKAAAQDNATQAQLDRAIGKFWWMQELTDWREWLFRQSVAHRLLLGGLDDQISATSQYAMDMLPGLARVKLPPEDAAECEQAIDRNLHWRYDANHLYDDHERERLSRCATLALSRTENDSGQAMLRNLASVYQRENKQAQAPSRDLVMYLNLLWYAEQLPKDAKLIVWTATVHAARAQGPLHEETTGHLLAEMYGSRFSAVGFSACGGQSRMAGGPGKTLPHAPSESLEYQAAHCEGEAAWLDHARLQAMGQTSSRLFGQFKTADWSQYFDGIIVISDETAPTPAWPVQ